MGGLDWLLELVLVGLLIVTMVHAIRLERAIRALRDDRAAFGDALAGFDTSTRAAEAGITKLQAVASDAVQLINRRVEQAAGLKDDLVFLAERGESLADRLETLVRAGRSVAASPAAAPALAGFHPAAAEPAPKLRSQAERDLLQALRGAQ